MNKERIGKALAFLGFIIALYLFIFSLVLIKHSFSGLAEEALKFTRESTDPINAFGFGWVLTLIMQSSGAATSALVAMNVSGIIGASLLIFMIIGTRVGTSITALFVSLFIHAKRRDFRHGFEIGLANLVYAFPIAVIMYILEYFFRFFSYTGNFFVSLGMPFSIRFVDTITIPIINLLSFLPKSLLIIAGIFLLAISLKNLPRFIFNLWNADYLKKEINKHMKIKWKAFLIGFLITAILLSTSITITLLIPLIVTRVINLKKVIPYVIGANLGGVMDAVLGGLVVGETALPAIFAYVSFSVIGLLWLFNTDLLFDITKFISKKTLRVSRKRALVFVLAFVLLALILTFI